MAKKKVLTKEELLKHVIDTVETEIQVREFTKKLKSLKRDLNVPYKSIIDMYDVEKMANRILKDSTQELEVFKTCLHNVPLLISYFANRGYDRNNDDKRQLAFEAILNYPDELLNRLIDDRYYGRSHFSSEERQIIYNQHGDYMFESIKKSGNSLINYCLFFNEYASEEQLQFLVDVVSRRRSENMIDHLKYCMSNGNLNLTPKMIEQLEASELAMELLGKRKSRRY